MLRDKSYSIPALIDPDISFITYHMFLWGCNFSLPTLQTQSLFLLRSRLPADFFLYSSDKWLHKDSEIVHCEVMVVSMDEIG